MAYCGQIRDHVSRDLRDPGLERDQQVQGMYYAYHVDANKYYGK